MLDNVLHVFLDTEVYPLFRRTSFFWFELAWTQHSTSTDADDGYRQIQNWSIQQQKGKIFLDNEPQRGRLKTF